MRVDANTTIMNTIKDKITKLRFLGLNDIKGFRRILEAVILADMIEWCDAKDLDADILERLREILNKIFFHNDLFKISYAGERTYASINLPASNDEWKLVSDAPFVKVLNTNIAPKDSSLKWKPDENYTIKYILIYNLTGINKVPALDISKFTVHDKMNIYYYIDPKTNKKTFYYLDEDCKWLTVSEVTNTGGASTNTDTVTKMLQKLYLQDFSKSGNALSSALAYNDGEGTKWEIEPKSGSILLATDEDIKELFK